MSSCQHVKIQSNLNDDQCEITILKQKETSLVRDHPFKTLANCAQFFTPPLPLVGSFLLLSIVKFDQFFTPSPNAVLMDGPLLFLFAKIGVDLLNVDL